MLQVLDSVRSIPDEYLQAATISALAPHLSADLCREASAIALNISSEWNRDAALESLLTRFIEPGDGDGALQLIQSMSLPYVQASAIAVAASGLSDVQDNLLRIARSIPYPYWKAEALGALAQYAAEGERRSVIREALAEIRIDDAEDRATTLASLAAYLSDARLREAFVAVNEVKDDFSVSNALLALAPRLPDDLIDQALQKAFSIRYAGTVVAALASRLNEVQLQLVLNEFGRLRGDRVKVMRALAPYLSERTLPQAFKVAQNIDDNGEGAKLLVALIPWLNETLLVETLEIARGMSDEEQQVELLAALIPLLSADKRSAVLEELLGIAELESHSAELAVCLAKVGHYERALQSLDRIRDRQWLARALESVTPLAPDSLLPKLCSAADRLDWPDRASFMAALGERLSEGLFTTLLGPVLASDKVRPESMVERVLVPLLQLKNLPEGRRPIILKRAIDLTTQIHELNVRSRVLGVLGPCLIDNQAIVPMAELYELWRPTLQQIAKKNRTDLLGHLRNLASVIVVLGGTEAIEETFQAVRQAEQWWP